MEILWLGQPACHIVASVGGKAANLSRLASQFPVPPGFCLPASASRAAGGPTNLQALVSASYNSLAERCGRADPPVAVRSSAVDEDGATASFAGQHETYLNIVGGEAVWQAIERCWASGLADRALAYRQQHGLSSDGSGVAVLVQQLAPADVSAVVFSANPVTGNRDEIVVTASWGLGESIVGGTVTPDTFTVHKAGLVMRDRTIADKQRMTVSGPVGTREVDVPRFMRSQPSLTEAQAIEMATLAHRLEVAMGWPVDVECAYAGGQLALLQCRPITTLPGPAH